MRLLRDHRGNELRLTDERLAHIREHPEMKGLEPMIEETVMQPEYVVRSYSDEHVSLYYRRYSGTAVGNKWLCVVVKFLPKDAFVVTAYLTDKVKKGEILWPTSE